MTGTSLWEIWLSQDVLDTCYWTNITLLIDVFELMHLIGLVNYPITFLEMDQFISLWALVEKLIHLGSIGHLLGMPATCRWFLIYGGSLRRCLSLCLDRWLDWCLNRWLGLRLNSAWTWDLGRACITDGFLLILVSLLKILEQITHQGIQSILLLLILRLLCSIKIATKFVNIFSFRLCNVWRHLCLLLGCRSL